MRIVIDLQSAQTYENENTTICRFTLGLAKALVLHREHEFFIALNGLYKNTIEIIRAEFADLLPQENIRLWYAVRPVHYLHSEEDWSRHTAELTREAFLTHLKPDMVIVGNLFGSPTEDLVSSIGVLNKVVPTAVLLHDSSFLREKNQFTHEPLLESWALNKLSHLSRADLLLTLSQQITEDATQYLGFSEENTIHITGAAAEQFKPIAIKKEEEKELRSALKLSKPFIVGYSYYPKDMEILLESFAKLPKKMRSERQLLIIAPKSNSLQSKDFEALFLKAKIRQKEVLLLETFTNKQLLLIYNLCEVFVFPAQKDKGTLALLEAMSCGQPILAHNSRSIREIISEEKALFETHELAEKLYRILSDNKYRQEVCDAINHLAQTFSMQSCAKNTLSALENWQKNQKKSLTKSSIRRPRLAYISPLPPARSGISFYSAELLPALHRFYDIEVIVEQEEKVNDPWINANCSVRNIKWFATQGYRYYDRVLYHFGNSPFHLHMYKLLELIPGVVVLHDFFLSDLVGTHMDVYDGERNRWAKELYLSHGYKAVHDRFTTETTVPVIAKYPCNLTMLQQAKGVIVHSEHSRQLAQQYFGAQNAKDWGVIPLLQRYATDINRKEAREALQIQDNQFLVCSFGMLNATKQNHRLIEAWLGSSLAQNKECVLIFVGELTALDYEQQLHGLIAKSSIKGQIRITGWVDTNQFRQYLAASDIAVQFRAKSRGETSAAVLDCMNYGLATIVNANGSMAELPDHCVYKLPDLFSNEELIQALERLKSEDDFRVNLGILARQFIKTEHSPAVCAEQYLTSIEDFYKRDTAIFPAFAQSLAQIQAGKLSKDGMRELAVALEKSIPPTLCQKQLFLDVSALVETDLRTGIQRVVRSILTEWLNNPPAGYRLEPIFCLYKDQYRYARRFTLNFLGCPSEFLDDDIIEFRPGDVYLGLDLAHSIVVSNRDFYQDLRRHGVKVMFLIYDLLPLQFPQSFYQSMDEWHQKWLEVVAQNDAAICISKTVADDFKNWWNAHQPKRLRPFQVSWFHLGADIKNSVPTVGMPEDAEMILEHLKNSKTFLMVGTIEPRKGYRQTLAAFEKLWLEDNSILLVIIGKKGWMMDSFIEQLVNHKEFGKRLIWLEGISDEYMEKIYSSAICLIAASEGEGFGLPLIEAAQHKLHIFARDIPVFREVAGEHAYYFDSTSSEDFAKALGKWLALYEKGLAPQSYEMPWLTWEQSAQQLSMALVPEHIEYQEMIN